MKLATCACGVQWEVKKLMPHHACEKCKEARRLKWKKAHPEVYSQIRERWRTKNKAKLAVDLKAWKKANPDRVRTHQRRAQRNYRKKQRLLNKQLIATLPCLDCGVSHAIERRQAVIRRVLPATREEIIEAWPCFWRGTAGQARLARDLRAMGATSREWVWQIRRAA